MIMQLYAGIGLAILVLILSARSHKTMNALSKIHAAAYLLITIYALMYTALPSYYLADRYFFMDHLGAFEVIISALLFFLSAVYSKGYVEGLMKIGELDRGNLKLFYTAFNLLLIAVTYSFLSNNLALFWIFAELTTVFSAMLVVTLNAKKNIGAALKYLFMASTSMLFSFVGLIFLFTLTGHALGAGTLNWDILMSNAAQLSPKILFAAFIFMFIGFAAKSGVAPFHGWLPTVYAKAPSAISAILSGSVSTVGLYGIIRAYAIVHQTSASYSASLLLMAFGFFSVAVAAFSMLAQINLKKLIAFSSIENTGLMLIGTGIGTPIAIFWMLFHMLAHALTKALLFFSGGVMHRQYGSMHIDRIKNALKLQPLASLGIIIGCAAIIGMPPFAIFLSKLYILLQAGMFSNWMLFGLLLLLLVAAGAFAMYLTRMFSQTGDDIEGAHVENYTPSRGMNASIIVLIALIFVLGVFFPQYLTDLLNSIVSELGL